MKRELTEAEKAKRAERRAQFRNLVKQVAAMSDVERATLTSRLGAVPTCEGRELSLHNTMLVILQRPDVSMVGGFRQWRKMGRTVRKGEHGQMIWVPLGMPKANGEGIAEAAQQVEAGEGLSFIMGTVFDIGQTEELSPDKEQEEQAA